LLPLAGGSFRALRGGLPAPSSSLIGTFACGASLAIQNIRGTIGDYLDCSPTDLQGYGWRSFLHPDDRQAIFQMAQDLQAGRAGKYDCRAQGRPGEPIVYLHLRTLIVQEQGQLKGAEGLIDLAHVEARRTIMLP
jgi:PAS domain-containing protein